MLEGDVRVEEGEQLGDKDRHGERRVSVGGGSVPLRGRQVQHDREV